MHSFRPRLATRDSPTSKRIAAEARAHVARTKAVQRPGIRSKPDYYITEARRRRDQLRRKLQEEEATVATFCPRTNDLKNKDGRPVEERLYSKTHVQDQQRKRDEMRSIVNQCTFAPEINQYSSGKATQDVPVHERLYVGVHCVEIFLL